MLAPISLTSSSGTSFAQPVFGGVPNPVVTSCGLCTIARSIELMFEAPAARCEITAHAVRRGVSASAARSRQPVSGRTARELFATPCYLGRYRRGSFLGRGYGIQNQ